MPANEHRARRAAVVAGTVTAIALLVPGAGLSGASAEPASAGIVDITAHLGYQQLDTIGTGMLVGPGEVLTNNHVIRGETAVRVADLASGRTYAAVVVGYDEGADVAVLRLEHAPRLAAVATGDSSKAHVGDPVTAIGDAGGNGGTRRTTGKIVAFGRAISAIDESGNTERLTGLIEMSAQLSPGDSGGPLLDGAGRVIGMDTAGSGHFRGQGFNNDGFAIPIDRALSIAGEIERGHASASVHVGPNAFLGVNIGSPGHLPGSRQVGALVTGVLPGTPAVGWGSARGDIVYSVDGHLIEAPSGLTGLLATLTPGTTVRLRWIDPAGKTHRAARAPRRRPAAVRPSALPAGGAGPGGTEPEVLPRGQGN